MSVGLALNQPRPNLQLHHFLPDISHSTRSSLNVTTLAHSHRKDTVPPRDTVSRVADGARARARAYKLSGEPVSAQRACIISGQTLVGGSLDRVSIDAVRFYQSRRRPRHQIILFIERKRSLNRRARYVVYLLRLVVFLPTAVSSSLFLPIFLPLLPLLLPSLLPCSSFAT